MNVIEFIFLILGSICLIDFTITTLQMYEFKELKELYDMYGLNTETKIKRYFEILIIIITTAIFIYKYII